MSKVMSYLVCVALVLSMATQVFAANEWANTSTDGKWSTAANWDTTDPGPPIVLTHQVPFTTPDYRGDARINLTGANACNIDVSMALPANANCQWLHIGDSADGTLNVVNTGSLGTLVWGPGEIMMGEAAGKTGVLNVDGVGSVARGEGLRIGRNAAGQFAGTATVNLTNGGELYGVWWDNWIGNSGTINIDHVSKMWILGAAILQIDGLINLTGTSAADSGVLFVQTNRKAMVDAYIAAGKIRGNGIVGDVYSYIDENGNTIVKIPEPITVALLGLGGLFLRRRIA